MKMGGRTQFPKNRELLPRRRIASEAGAESPTSLKILATTKGHIKYTQQRMDIFFLMTQLLSMNPSSLDTHSVNTLIHSQSLIKVTDESWRRQRLCEPNSSQENKKGQCCLPVFLSALLL